MAEALARSPSELFRENEQMFKPSEDVAMNGQAQTNRQSLRQDFAAVTETSIKPAESASAPAAAMQPAQEFQASAQPLSYRAENTGYSLQNFHQGSDVVAFGSTAAQLGMEAGKELGKLAIDTVSSLFGALTDKKDQGPAVDNDNDFRARPQPSFPVASGPSPSGGMA